MNMKFQAKAAIWTEHCGIVSLNPSIELQHLFTTEDGRLIACQLNHVNNLFPPITLINIYAPAQPALRKTFYEYILALPIFQDDQLVLHDTSESSSDHELLSAPCTRPLMVVGDFNYHANSYAIDNTDYTNDAFSPPTTQSNLDAIRAKHSQQLWHEFILAHLHECTHSRDDTSYVPTFRRGSSATTIDYIFASPILFQHLVNSDIQFMAPEWTDHACLSATFRFKSSHQGKGLWRAHPGLAEDPYFQSALNTALDSFFQDYFNTELTPQAQWDEIKLLTKSIAQQTSRRKRAFQNRLLKRLQKKRNKFLRKYKSYPILNLRLPAIENMISIVQRDIAETAALRAGRHWRENGETSAGYLKRTITSRAVKRAIPSLQHPDYNDRLCTSPAELQDATSCFCKSLYTPDPVQSPAIDKLIETIPSTDRIPEADHTKITKKFTLTDIQTGATRSPSKSSPGMDGLPYEIISFLLTLPR
jgi:exonuclease III